MLSTQTQYLKNSHYLTLSEATNNHQNKLVIPYCHRAISKRSVAFTAYKLWNQEVPIDIKPVKMIKGFNKSYRKDLLSNINA